MLVIFIKARLLKNIDFQHKKLFNVFGKAINSHQIQSLSKLHNDLKRESLLPPLFLLFRHVLTGCLYWGCCHRICLRYTFYISLRRRKHPRSIQYQPLRQALQHRHYSQRQQQQPKHLFCSSSSILTILSPNFTTEQVPYYSFSSSATISPANQLC